jgi:hypothetical protein
MVYRQPISLRISTSEGTAEGTPLGRPKIT